MSSALCWFLNWGLKKIQRPRQQLLLFSLPLTICEIPNLRSCLLGHIDAKMVNEHMAEYPEGTPMGRGLQMAWGWGAAKRHPLSLCLRTQADNIQGAGSRPPLGQAARQYERAKLS